MTARQFTLVIRPEAKAEVAEATRWYESRERGLGREFVRAFKAGTAGLRRNPYLYQVVKRQIRRLVLRRFPYSVFYEIQDANVVLIACHHEARDPESWQQRLDRLQGSPGLIPPPSTAPTPTRTPQSRSPSSSPGPSWSAADDDGIRRRATGPPSSWRAAFFAVCISK